MGKRIERLLINLLRRVLGGGVYLKFISYKNKVEAMVYAIRQRDSYSQHGEDKLVRQLLEKLNLKDLLYVDIGANHPIKISNTYLLYRNGMRGIVIEPNRDFLFFSQQLEFLKSFENDLAKINRPK